MSPAAPGAGGALPGRSEIEEWPTQHLDDTAAQLRSMGAQSVTLFDEHRQSIAAPGGTAWEGDAKDAALNRVTADSAVVQRQTAVQDQAADTAENGGHDVRAAKREALEAITEAENNGFSVGEDLTVTDTRKYDINTIAERNMAAAEHAEDIRWYAERLVQADTFAGRRLQAKASELEGIRFDGEGAGRNGEGTVRLVDHKVQHDTEDHRDEPGDKPTEQATGQIGPFAVPKSVEDAAKKAEDKPPVTSDVGGDLGDLLVANDTPDGRPEDGQAAKPGDEKPAGLPPVLSQVPPPPDKAAIDRQAAQVEAARQNLAAAQAKLDDAAGQDYMQGAGTGPGRDVSGPLAQAVFDARAELTEQRRLLNELNYASAAAGGPTAPVAPLPENADVQAYPPEPSAFAEGSRALSEGSLGLIPDVAKDIDTFNNWDQASGAERTQAVLDAAGMVPLPGAKLLGEGIEHGLDAVTGSARHLDDAPGIPHSQTDAPSGAHAPVEHHAPASSPAEHHTPPDPAHSDFGADHWGGFPQVELDMADTAHDIFTSSGMDELRQAAQNGVAAEVEINGYKVLYEPDIPGSGFSLASFGERGFAIGPEGMSSDLELARTVAQEVYRVNMTEIPELGIDATRAASETQAAFDFAQKFGETFLNGGG
ncbi:hypothetical protein M1247_35135 [Mycobacterium sp. 21AC1]|uniref:hypothetical protein n=1 Tax=[Mycobacterium] appelbergii TaxID=2939269 RepID=UPI0029390CE0|nr:hypothetical protein [Mycobacterium sp. 21AC1]MDV3130183.1 hypothetical protein [Mycobacterium sp. 21AC1]